MGLPMDFEEVTGKVLSFPTEEYKKLMYCAEEEKAAAEAAFKRMLSENAVRCGLPPDTYDDASITNKYFRKAIPSLFSILCN